MPSAVFVAAFDSQLKWCASILRVFERDGFECQVLVPDVRNAVSDEQLRAAGLDAVEKVSWKEMISAALNADVAVCGLSGPFVKRMTLDINRFATARRPVLVVGWVGVIIEKLIAGYLDRAGADVVAVNSKEDFSRFSTTAERLGLPDDNLLLTGLSYLPPHAALMKTGPIRTVLFADQPTIPAERVERRYVYERLIEYARAHPERKVILKPRHRPGEDTFHKMKHHPEDLLRGVELPENFRIGYEPVTEALETTDLLLTVSSTSCLEAVAAGVRTALILDFGIHERYGNQVFVHSGLLRTFSQIMEDNIGQPANDWLESYFFDAERPANAMILERVRALLATNERPSVAVMDTPYFRSVEDFQQAIMRLRRPANTYVRLLDKNNGSGVRKLVKIGYRWTPPAMHGMAKRILRSVGLI